MLHHWQIFFLKLFVITLHVSCNYDNFKETRLWDLVSKPHYHLSLLFCIWVCLSSAQIKTYFLPDNYHIILWEGKRSTLNRKCKDVVKRANCLIKILLLICLWSLWNPPSTLYKSLCRALHHWQWVSWEWKIAKNRLWQTLLDNPNLHICNDWLQNMFITMFAQIAQLK